MRLSKEAPIIQDPEFRLFGGHCIESKTGIDHGRHVQWIGLSQLMSDTLAGMDIAIAGARGGYDTKSKQQAGGLTQGTSQHDSEWFQKVVGLC